MRPKGYHTLCGTVNEILVYDAFSKDGISSSASKELIPRCDKLSSEDLEFLFFCSERMVEKIKQIVSCPIKNAYWSLNKITDYSSILGFPYDHRINPMDVLLQLDDSFLGLSLKISRRDGSLCLKAIGEKSIDGIFGTEIHALLKILDNTYKLPTLENRRSIARIDSDYGCELRECAPLYLEGIRDYYLRLIRRLPQNYIKQSFLGDFFNSSPNLYPPYLRVIFFGVPSNYRIEVQDPINCVYVSPSEDIHYTESGYSGIIVKCGDLEPFKLRFRFTGKPLLTSVRLTCETVAK